MTPKKRNLTFKRRLRVRNRLKRCANARPRFSVFRSNKNIYAQIIDDEKGVTLVAASSVEKSFGGGNNITIAAKVGTEIANRAKKSKITEVVFDRGAYLFHGKVKALANAARAGGLNF